MSLYYEDDENNRHYRYQPEQFPDLERASIGGSNDIRTDDVNFLVTKL